MMKRRVGRLTVGTVVACVAACAMLTTGSGAAPPDDTYEISVVPTEATQGTVLQVSGTCYSELLGGPTERANIRGYRIVDEPGSMPFDFSDQVPVRADATFGGQLRVPAEAPAGDYMLSLICITQDQAFGRAQAPFTVTGEPAPPTTTTEVTPPVPPVLPPAPPAAPIDGQAEFTG